MDNNRYSSNRPRRKVSRRTYRNRRLAALAIIAFLILLLIVLIANACTDDKDKKTKTDNKTAVTLTTTTTVTDSAIPTTTTTTVVATVPKNESDFKLDRQTISIMVDETDMPRVLEYPDGTVEADERWTSSDKEVATVDSYGHITGVSPGVCYVILKSAADVDQEVWIKVTVRGEAADDDDDTTTPQSSRTEAPAPPVYDTEGLTYIDGILLVNKEYSVPATFEPKLEQICYDQFNKLSTDAAKEGLSIYISSGYRSYKDQETIYNNYIEEEKKKGNSEAEAKKIVDTYSARPGYSEHQTGLCIDVNSVDDSFGYTDEAAWLAEHAHEYGFIIRYPLGKEAITGYQYEPWHIRYVGSKVAEKIYKKGLCLEEYLNVG